MGKAKTLPIDSAVLRWAMTEAGHTAGSLATKLQVDADDVREWMANGTTVNLTMLRKLSSVLRRPSAALLLPSPPDDAPVAAAFRQAPGTTDSDELSPDEARIMREAWRRQDAASELLAASRAGRVEIPRLAVTQPPPRAATQLRAWLGIDVAAQMGWDTPSEAVAAWREALESHGILVFLLAIGKNGLRGFSVPDDYAPLIVANTTGYTPEARIFTLWHELAHLALGDDSVCERTYFFDGPDVERWCESVAANALLPAQAVRDFARGIGLSPGGRYADVADARRIAGALHVSVAATIIRLINLGLAESGLRSAIPRADVPRAGGGGRGEKRAERRLRELGYRYTTLMVDGWAEGRIPAHDAVDALSVHTTDLGRLEELLTAGATA